MWRRSTKDIERWSAARAPARDIDGRAEAQLTQAFMYALGDGVPENDVKAYSWLSIAKAQSHEKQG